jgi:hypothetical protein
MTRRLMVVLLDAASRAELEAAIADEGDGSPSIYVVAPSHVGPLEWLATDEDRAHGEAGARAIEAEWLLADAGDVAGEVGDPDPVLAVEDALRRFPADEIVVVGNALDASLLSSLRSFRLPVTWTGLSLSPATRRTRTREMIRALASGRSDGTPFVAFVGANLGLLLIAVAASLLALLLIWVAGIL